MDKQLSDEQQSEIPSTELDVVLEILALDSDDINDEVFAHDDGKPDEENISNDDEKTTFTCEEKGYQADKTCAKFIDKKVVNFKKVTDISIEYIHPNAIESGNERGVKSLLTRGRQKFSAVFKSRSSKNEVDSTEKTVVETNVEASSSAGADPTDKRICRMNQLRKTFGKWRSTSRAGIGHEFGRPVVAKDGASVETSGKDVDEPGIEVGGNTNAHVNTVKVGDVDDNDDVVCGDSML